MRVGDLGRAQRGFTLLVVLGLVALLGLGLSLAGPVWSAQQAREREREWLRIGEAYARALTDYWAQSPGGARQLPGQLEDLLIDRRFVGVRRHLRQLYADPLRPGQAWSVIRDRQGRVAGVFSPSEAQPLMQDAAHHPFVRLDPKARGYARWQFVPISDTP